MPPTLAVPLGKNGVTTLHVGKTLGREVSEVLEEQS